MEHSFKIGDHVKWNSEAGYVSGKIIKIHTTDFDYKATHITPPKKTPNMPSKAIRLTILQCIKEKHLRN